ncbi:MAG: hypothetical protein KGJ02_05520, partial [Verrucomicrobiota bacterium]|nr:hypothetical protein [Verrucomicrobiota bacterium]
FGKAGGQDFHQAEGWRERVSLFVIGGPERGWKGWNAGFSQKPNFESRCVYKPVEQVYGRSSPANPFLSALGRNGLSNCHAEVHDWIRSEFTPALDRLFPPK